MPIDTSKVLHGSVVPYQTHDSWRTACGLTWRELNALIVNTGGHEWAANRHDITCIPCIGALTLPARTDVVAVDAWLDA